MREEERILAGLLFSPADPELRRIKQKTHNLNIDYNQTHEDEMEKRAAILREMLGELGEGCFFQGPIHFHYGIHTKIGKGLFANFNLTVQDDCSVTIGDYCQFGPNVTIVTPIHPMLAEERYELMTPSGPPGAVLRKAGAHRQLLLVGRRSDGLPRGDHRQRLRNRRRQCGHPGHPGKHLRRRCALQSNPAHHPGGQHAPPSGAVRRLGPFMKTTL